MITSKSRTQPPLTASSRVTMAGLRWTLLHSGKINDPFSTPRPHNLQPSETRASSQRQAASEKALFFSPGGRCTRCPLTHRVLPWGYCDGLAISHSPKGLVEASVQGGLLALGREYPLPNSSTHTLHSSRHLPHSLLRTLDVRGGARNIRIPCQYTWSASADRVPRRGRGVTTGAAVL